MIFVLGSKILISRGAKIFKAIHDCQTQILIKEIFKKKSKEKSL